MQRCAVRRMLLSGKRAPSRARAALRPAATESSRSRISASAPLVESLGELLLAVGRNEEERAHQASAGHLRMKAWRLQSATSCRPA